MDFPYFSNWGVVAIRLHLGIGGQGGIYVGEIGGGEGRRGGPSGGPGGRGQSQALGGESQGSQRWLTQVLEITSLGPSF